MGIDEYGEIISKGQTTLFGYGPNREKIIHQSPSGQIELIEETIFDPKKINPLKRNGLLQMK